MKYSAAVVALSLYCIGQPLALGFSPKAYKSIRTTTRRRRRTVSSSSNYSSLTSQLLSAASHITAPPTEEKGFARGKVNEIDFCISPSDVSLSRSYENSSFNAGLNTVEQDGSSSPRKLSSLTRALNNASNRAVRRILLSRAWPSADALNESLRRVLASERQAAAASSPADLSSEEESKTVAAATLSVDTSEDSGPKCPVPQPILNILMRRSSSDGDKSVVNTPDQSGKSGRRKGRSDEEWVKDQIQDFKDSYGSLSGYSFAEDYLECVLSLATTGVESPKVKDVLNDGLYAESYQRLLNVLSSVGADLIDVPGNDHNDPPLRKISAKLNDANICLSMMDNITIGREKKLEELQGLNEDVNSEKYSNKVNLEEIKENVTETVPIVTEAAEKTGAGKNMKKSLISRLFKRDAAKSKESVDQVTNDDENIVTKSKKQEEEDTEEVKQIKEEELGGVLLSSSEPSMTRQLNVLSNIVQRALLFGGDNELLVLYQTLEADKNAFVERWYPKTSTNLNEEDEDRPGVQYFNCLVKLLKNCYSEGIVADLNPPLSLNPVYANAYERLVASLVELGSGYINPFDLEKIVSKIPQTPTEEFGRFVRWEAGLRKINADVTAYPDELVGPWEVRDEIGGRTIGLTTVNLAAEGQVEMEAPLKGLRWRLDPGPTHLDTLTFQVLNEDSTILQYKGFIDRGARLEARFSKRPVTARGAVTFQMRDGEALLMGDDYRKDMLPVQFKTATTKFSMKKLNIRDNISK